MDGLFLGIKEPLLRLNELMDDKDDCVFSSKNLIDSIVLSKNSILIGDLYIGVYKSTIPPLCAYSFVNSTLSFLLKLFESRIFKNCFISISSFIEKDARDLKFDIGGSLS